MNHNPRSKIFSVLNGLLPWVLFAFYFFILPSFEPVITPIVHEWINSLGIWAPVGYISFGTLATVIAPIGLGPINVVLQRAFGFWPSVLYFWSFEIIGMSINFWLSRRFGHKFLHLFFAGIITKDSKGNFNDPITKISTFMLNKNSWSAFAVMLGMGGELLAYLAGLSNLKFLKFLAIIIITQFINSLIFVGSNLTIGTNNTVYFSLQILSFGITLIPVLILFHQEILDFCKIFWQFWKAEKKLNEELKIKIQELKEQKILEIDFNLWYLNYLDEYLKLNFLLYKYLSFLTNYDQILDESIRSDIKQKLKKISKKLGYYPKKLYLEILKKERELDKNQLYIFKFNENQVISKQFPKT